MAKVAKGQKADWTYGEWGNLFDAPIATVDEILGKLQPNFDPEMDSAKRKRNDAYLLVKKYKLENMDAVNAFEVKQREEKLKELPEPYRTLERPEVEALLDKARSRVDLSKYGEADTWKLAKVLHDRIKAKYNDITLDAFRALVVPEKGARTGRVMAHVFNKNEPLPTLAPKGLSERAVELIAGIRAQFGEDNIKAIGRNKGLRATAVVQFTDNTRIAITMPDEYVWPSEENKTEGATANA